jgi:poly-gamma-glutamate synthesis protein (capsule biosynthesis protein)
MAPSKIDRRTVLLAAASLALAGGGAAAEDKESAEPPIYRSESGDITMAFGGDTMLTRGLTPFTEPDYLALVQLIRGTDFFASNFETVVRNQNEGFARAGGGGGTPMTTPPALVDDLKWMGVKAVSCANNHVGDWAETGMLAQFKHLHEHGLPFAGSGPSMEDARNPVYVDTAAGRVGFIAAASTGANNAAVDPTGDTPGRPGLNPLAYTMVYEVDAQSLVALKRMDKELGFAQQRVRDRLQFYPLQREAEQEGMIRFGNLEIHQGSGFSATSRINKGDSDANLKSIREAVRQSDWQVFSLHNHQFGSAGSLIAKGDPEMPAPAEFWVEFAHAAVDAGADAVFGHGPHVTLGVEIYKGRPIFYSLGNFIFQNDTIQAVPPGNYRGFGLSDTQPTAGEFMDARSGNGTRSFGISPEYWQSFIPVAEFRNKQLAQLTLHPIDLGFGRSRADQGRPVLARGEVARKILARAQERSKMFGTEITIKNDIGIVRVYGA